MNDISKIVISEQGLTDLKEIIPIDILTSYINNGTLTDEDICFAMQEYHCKLANAYKQSTVDSLKSSLMDRFKQMHHASEERYAEEAAKFFAWIVDSWKREEEANSTTAENNCSECGTYVAFGADICTICDLLKI